MSTKQGVVHVPLPQRIPKWMLAIAITVACFGLLYGIVQVGEYINSTYGLPVNPYAQ